ncbi:tRNA 2-selenouridine(34) synthase MnmH [Chryseolinea sp. T2]|uniref:tRNA 2-selenouridine(34) synthase MnmH n=1 Tax=Chryseolinea sp. T2 TaxID=3129255 RepID=UPI003077A1BE
MRLDISDFLNLRRQLPVVDVRSEGEYLQGHIPKVHNIPVLNDAERHQVGIDYKQKGQAEAIRTGFRLVGPRLAGIIDESAALGNEIIVHCWRGGMRSSNFCGFVEMARQKTHQLAGGYKSYRNKVHESFKEPMNMIVVGGCTGSGKSDILRKLADYGEQVIDLEHLAHHKGSVFGGLMMPAQPTTEQFENNLFEVLAGFDRSKRIWVEDESHGVGRIFLPDAFWQQMNVHPVIEVMLSKEARIKRLVSEYGPADRDAFLAAMSRITKKLGGQHFNAAKEKLLSGDMAATIDILLTYYDKAYLMGLEKKSSRLASRFTWNGNDLDAIARELIHSQAILHK